MWKKFFLFTKMYLTGDMAKTRQDKTTSSQPHRAQDNASNR